jgi:fluoroquinolone resistance protein
VSEGDADAHLVQPNPGDGENDRAHATEPVGGFEDAMSSTPIEALAPEGIATRHDIELACPGDGSPVRFAGWDLSATDLKGLDLRECTFVRCRAGRADFATCDLTEARFLSCDLNNTHWRRAALSSATFQDCKLTGAQIVDARTFGLTFEKCLLIDAQLHGLSFRRLSLDHIDFQGADLTATDFREAVLTGCNLRDANVTNARFEGADLRGADLGNLRLIDASRFKGAIISKQQAATLLSGLGLRVF